MRTRLFYFSGTGNSLKIAHDIAGNIEDSEIVHIEKAINRDLKFTDENVGIIYPVYMMGLPLIVADFVKKIPLTRDNYYGEH